VGEYGIKSEKFWEVIAEKDALWFEKFMNWNQSNNLRKTVWNMAEKYMKSKYKSTMLQKKNIEGRLALQNLYCNKIE
jgi:hypothetical protein